MITARGDERGDVRRAGAHARVVGDHRALVADRHHGRDRRARAARSRRAGRPRPRASAPIRSPAASSPSGEASAVDSPSRAVPIAVIAPPPGVRTRSPAKRSSPSCGRPSRPDERHVHEGGDGHDHVDAHRAALFQVARRRANRPSGEWSIASPDRPERGAERERPRGPARLSSAGAIAASGSAAIAAAAARPRVLERAQPRAPSRRARPRARASPRVRASAAR